jgi:hypothetical protein
MTTTPRPDSDEQPLPPEQRATREPTDEERTAILTRMKANTERDLARIRQRRTAK